MDTSVVAPTTKLLLELMRSEILPTRSLMPTAQPSTPNGTATILPTIWPFRHSKPKLTSLLNPM